MRAIVLALAAMLTACGGAVVHDRGDPGPDPTPTGEPEPGRPMNLEAAFARFSACMERSTWNDTNMPSVANQIAESDAGGGMCASCHNTGQGGAYLHSEDVASGGADMFFDMNRTRPYVQKLVLGTVDQNGVFLDLVPARRYIDKALDPNHPMYTLSDNRLNAVEQFVQLTLDRYHDYALDCAAPPP